MIWMMYTPLLISFLLLGYAFFLTRQLHSLYYRRLDLESLRSSVTTLFQKTETYLRSGETLNQKLTTLFQSCHTLHEDLYFLSARGETIARQLEKEVRRLRAPRVEDTQGEEIVLSPEPLSPFQQATGETSYVS